MAHIFLLCRDNLETATANLREEENYMKADVNSTNVRLFTVREEKIKAAAVLENLKKVEEDLERDMEDKSQVELEEKVTHGIDGSVLIRSLRGYI